MDKFKFSNPVTPEELELAYSKGMKKPEELNDGDIYSGYCRNARKAMWVLGIQKFVHIREKFGDYFLESINHPANDDGYDLFIPQEKTILTEKEYDLFQEGLQQLVKWETSRQEAKK